jgi:hypothetical protein
VLLEETRYGEHRELAPEFYEPNINGGKRDQGDLQGEIKDQLHIN